MSLATVAISADFLTAFAKLPKKIQQKTKAFVAKFQSNPTSPGINYEKISNIDGKFCSVRIDKAYRGIVVRQEKTGTYLLVWVAHHDEAYEWAMKKRCAVNANTGSIQIYEVVKEPMRVETQLVHALFARYSDGQLLKIGVPQEQLSFIRSIMTTGELDQASESIPADAFEGLQWLANGFDFDEVIDVMGIGESKVVSDADDLGEALHNSSTLRSFVVVEGEEELASILRSPLDKWRTFLHPSQRSYVKRDYSGPCRILGGAGTGKTVVAMHRARELARNCVGDRRILFTTFSTNLANDIKANLDKLCVPAEMRRIEVINLDAWVSRFLASQGLKYRVSYEQAELEDLWLEASIEAGCPLDFEPSFYVDEWSQVILTMEELTLEAYVHAKRAGRGSRLRRDDRKQVWGVVERYRRLMEERSLRDVDAAMWEARILIERNPSPIPYASVVVDEAQDFSVPAFRLIRALAGKEHPNDIFIVGDSHQRIYRKRAVLSRCGINIRGRASRLRVNYRTPEEIRRAAVAIIAGLSWDDLDGGVDEAVGDEVTQSLLHGERPELHEFRNAADELDWIAKCIGAAVNAGQETRDVCMVLRTKKLAEHYARGLEARGLKVLPLRPRQVDDRSIEGVRVATMHRVKGLEFDTVILAGMSDDTVPLAYLIKKAQVDGTVVEVERSERSLVYVAMTRAKRMTIITAPGRMSELVK